MGKTMIVAGIGSRKGVSADEVFAAIEAALAQHGLAVDALSAMATTDFKRGEAGISLAAERLGVPMIVVKTPLFKLHGTEGEERPQAGLDLLTRSESSLKIAGSPSVSESAALGAVGPGGRLLGPRTVVGRVTCAVAVGEGQP